MVTAQFPKQAVRRFNVAAMCLILVCCCATAFGQGPGTGKGKGSGKGNGPGQGKSAGNNTPSTSPDLTEPPRVPSKKNGTLESPLTVLFGTVEVPGLPADQNKIKVRAYGLTHPDKNDPKSTGTPLIPGPTFVFHPGDLVKLHLHNYLNRSTNPALNKFEKNPQETLPGTADDITGHASHEISIPNNADITNLHVHGLHVDPKQDNVTLLVLPEDSDPSGLIPELQRLVPTINRWWTRPYKYQIPTDHVPGTFWYHSHKHGSTATQVENGMAGALVMRPNDDQDDIVPGLWNDNPALTHDRVLVIQGIMNVGTPQGETTGPFVKQSLSSPVGTVNGQYQPTLKLPAGQLERWRLVIAGANHKAAGSFWVGQIVVATIPKLNADVIAELRKITEDKTTLAPYISKPATKTLPSFTLQCNKIPGAVKLVAVDGVPMSQFVDISPSSPTFGGAGNRNDLLIQADKEGSYYLYQNYPFTLSQDELVSQMKAAYDNDADLFVGDAGANRYAALTSQKKYNFIEVLDDKTVKAVPNNFTTDPYSLGTNYQGFKPWWANVDDNGPVNDPAPTQQSVVPLLSGDADSTPQRVDVNKKFPAFPDGLGWQPTGAGPGQPVGAAMLMKLNISGKVKPTMPTNDQLNKTLSQLSPASKNPADTKLKRLNSQGQLVPGIPSYVAQLPASFQGFDGVQVVVFDRAQFTFDYLDKKTGTTLNFRQFWLNGREFSPDDFVGNPISQQLIQSPMEDVEPSLGSYSPSGTENLWTHRVKTDQGPSLLITNPGYFRNVVAAKDSKGNSITVTDPATKKSVPAYNYDYQGVTTKPTYKNVTGLKAPKQPQSTTVEEWLLINNSDMFHPFHIHISPFFVEEIGQLNYDSNAKDPTKPWTLKNLSDSDSPFKWVANNWWDVIVLPPHGYVRMWTWINVPDQLPENTADEHSKMFVVENANVYGSWVTKTWAEISSAPR